MTKCESFENLGNIFQEKIIVKWEQRTEINNILDRVRPDSKKIKIVKAMHSVTPRNVSTFESETGES